MKRTILVGVGGLVLGAVLTLLLIGLSVMPRLSPQPEPEAAMAEMPAMAQAARPPAADFSEADESLRGIGAAPGRGGARKQRAPAAFGMQMDKAMPAGAMAPPPPPLPPRPCRRKRRPPRDGRGSPRRSSSSPWW